MANRRDARVLIVSVGGRENDRLTAALREIGAQALGEARDGEEALARIRGEQPDAILAALPETNAQAFVQSVRNLRAQSLPAAVSIALSGQDELRGEGADGYCASLAAPVGAKALDELLKRLLPEHRLSPNWGGEARVKDALIALRVPVRLKGFGYLAWALEMTLRDDTLTRRLSTALYPAVSRRFSVSEHLVERAIYTAIAAAWDRDGAQALYALFGNTVDAERGKPTNRGFLARVAQAIRMEEW